MQEQKEKKLIAQCKRGDGEAFAELLEDYRIKLSGYIFKMCGDKNLAEDTLQDTLIKVWKGIKKYDERNRFSSWLFSVAHNTAVDALRTKNRRKFVEHKSEIETRDIYSDANSNLENDEMKLIIEKAIAGLSEKQKQVFLLRQHSGMTFREIADEIDEPLNTVLSRMNYAVKKLKEALKVNYEK